MNIQERLDNGEHIYFGEWEIYKSYTGIYWVRRECKLYGEQAWEIKPFYTLEKALEYIGYPVSTQIRFDWL